MILEINDNHQNTAVEITAAGGKRKIQLGGRDILLDCVKLADGHYSLILDSCVYDLRVNLKNDTCTVAGRAGTSSFRIADSRHSGVKPEREEMPSGLQRICAEMPGKIIRILVKTGETVVCDQGLLILEAMKMQNEIRSPKGGVVKEIAAVAGTAVNTGEFLLSVE